MDSIGMLQSAMTMNIGTGQRKLSLNLLGTQIKAEKESLLKLGEVAQQAAGTTGKGKQVNILA